MHLNNHCIHFLDSYRYFADIALSCLFDCWPQLNVHPAGIRWYSCFRMGIYQDRKRSRNNLSRNEGKKINKMQNNHFHSEMNNHKENIMFIYLCRRHCSISFLNFDILSIVHSMCHDLYSDQCIVRVLTLDRAWLSCLEMLVNFQCMVQHMLNTF